MSIDWSDYTQGGIGAIIGSILTVLGFRGRLDTIERNHDELKKETHAFFKEIRDDIKILLARKP